MTGSWRCSRSVCESSEDDGGGVQERSSGNSHMEQGVWRAPGMMEVGGASDSWGQRLSCHVQEVRQPRGWPCAWVSEVWVSGMGGFCRAFLS